MKFADLHIHTRASDGRLSSEEVIKLAREFNLAAVSIADHDSIDGIEAALEAGERHGVEVIPGVELSVYIDDVELHILGYLVDWKDADFRTRLQEFQIARSKRAEQIVKKLCRLGITISYEDVLEEAGGGVVGRPHIALALLKRGYVETMQGAFERYIGDNCPAHVGKYRLSFIDGISIIHKAGGIPMLAHPVFGFKDEMLPDLVRAGLEGIEVYHTKHDIFATRRFERLARQHNLLMVGGSDSHGFDVPIGLIRVPYKLVEKLKLRRGVEIRS